MTGIASKSQLRMSFLRYALVTVPLILLLGTASGRASGIGYPNPWFDALDKPGFMPPAWVFGFAWTILYILLGLSLALILHARGSHGRGVAVGVFVLQLLLNYAWTPIFVVRREIGLALFVVVLMILLTAATAWLFARIRPAAGWLLLPYLVWIMFAALLTFSIWQLNPNASELVPAQASTDIPL